MRIAIALVLLAAACGDGKHKPGMPDSGMEPSVDAMADAPVEQVTFTSYVIDMVTNGTNSTTQARPFAEFATLPDPDLDNATAYQSLF